MKPPDISFLVSCYNEEDNVVGAIDTIQSCLTGRHLTYEIIVIDDASTDGTASRVEAYRALHPDCPISLYRNERNRGLGWNYVMGASLARGRYYKLVLGDNEDPPEVITSALDHMGSVDLVIPYVANQHDRPFVRRIISRAFVFIVSLLSGHRLRFYNGTVLHLRANIERFKPKTSGFAYQAEILCQALDYGCSFVEIPYHAMVYPGKKTSAFRLRNILSVGISLCRIFLWRLGSRFRAS